MGLSGGAVVVWPAGSDTPRVLPGTDDGRAWSVAGIDSAGRVAAWDGAGAGYVWDRDGAGVALQPLPGHSSVRPRAIRNGWIVGESSDGVNTVIVTWDLNGAITRTLTGLESAVDINASGDVLGRDGSAVVVWHSPNHVEQVSTTITPVALSDSGVVHGWVPGGPPVRLSCG